MGVSNFKLTKVYQLAFEQAMAIFEITKEFSKEEKYSLIDQVRRSSRSVNANLVRHIVRKNILLTLYLKLLIAMQRILKPVYGWTSLSPATIFPQKNIPF